MKPERLEEIKREWIGSGQGLAVTGNASYRMVGELIAAIESEDATPFQNGSKRIKVLARKNLKMSPGKLAAQSVHAALALACQADLHPLMSVVVLEVNGRPFDEAKAAYSPVATVRDAGFTEVAPGTETCIAFLEDDPRAI